MSTISQEAVVARTAAPVPSQDTAVRTGRVARTFIYLVLLLFALFYLLPFAIMVINSLSRCPRSPAAT
jgi:glucose/mannose transport system permease protein